MSGRLGTREADELIEQKLQRSMQLHAAMAQGDTASDWPVPYKGGRDLMARLRERQEAQIRV